MKAVMLVGGFGTRLRPLTLDVKKELMPVANRPFLEHVLAHLAKHGVDEAILTTGYLAEAFEGFPEERAHGVKLTIVKEDEPLDTCGAVKNVEHLLDGTFLVLNGDIFTSLDITGLVSYHRERETLGTLDAEGRGGSERVRTCPDRRRRTDRAIHREAEVRRRRRHQPDQRRDVRPRTGSAQLRSGPMSRSPSRVACGPGGASTSACSRCSSRRVKRSTATSPTTTGSTSARRRSTCTRTTMRWRGSSASVPPGVEQRPGVWVGRSCEIDPAAVLRPPVAIGDNCRVGRATVGPLIVHRRAARRSVTER